MAGQPLIVRFSEWAYYDPINDSEAVKLMATTDRGTFCADVLVDDLKGRRQEFKDYVIEAMQRGQLPGELEFE